MRCSKRGAVLASGPGGLHFLALYSLLLAAALRSPIDPLPSSLTLPWWPAHFNTVGAPGAVLAPSTPPERNQKPLNRPAGSLVILYPCKSALYSSDCRVPRPPKPLHNGLIRAAMGWWPWAIDKGPDRLSRMTPSGNGAVSIGLPLKLPRLDWPRPQYGPPTRSRPAPLLACWNRQLEPPTCFPFMPDCSTTRPLRLLRLYPPGHNGGLIKPPVRDIDLRVNDSRMRHVMALRARLVTVEGM